MKQLQHNTTSPRFLAERCLIANLIFSPLTFSPVINQESANLRLVTATSPENAAQQYVLEMHQAPSAVPSAGAFQMEQHLTVSSSPLNVMSSPAVPPVTFTPQPAIQREWSIQTSPIGALTTVSPGMAGGMMTFQTTTPFNNISTHNDLINVQSQFPATVRWTVGGTPWPQPQSTHPLLSGAPQNDRLRLDQNIFREQLSARLTNVLANKSGLPIIDTSGPYAFLTQQKAKPSAQSR